MGICTVCGHRHHLTAHHKIRRSQGGDSRESNLVYVCRPCHDQIHGTVKGCDEYPDPIAAAHACAAHWDIVRASWKGRRSPLAYRARFFDYQGISQFAHLLEDALNESDPHSS